MILYHASDVEVSNPEIRKTVWFFKEFCGTHPGHDSNSDGDKKAPLTLRLKCFAPKANTLLA